MKLNLLPATVSKGKQARTAIVVSALIGVLSVLASIFLITWSGNEKTKAEETARAWEPAAKAAVDTAARGDAIAAESIMIVRNVDLANAMLNHNTVYPNLYDQVLPYLPRFFRVTSIQAQAAGTDAQITISGTVKTYQQYADLMLALMRIPEVKGVSRADYQVVDPYIPNLSPEDQTGKPIKPGQAPIPDDPLQRLDYYIGQGQVTGFTGEGGFGTESREQARGAMPGYSLVTLTVTLPKNLQVPVPGQTLAKQQGNTQPGGGTPGGGAPGGVPGGVPGGGPGMPPAPGGDR